MFSDICHTTHPKLVYGTCPWCGLLIVEGQPARAHRIREVADYESPTGPSLSEIVEAAGPLPPSRAAQLVAEVADALQRFHSQSKVHGSIRPAACRLANDGHIRIDPLDLTASDFQSSELVDLSIADFLAPEQALNSHGVNPRADVYSLGCLLYFFLIGRPPFPVGSISERLVKHQIDPPPSIRDVRPEVPPELENLCKKMMAKRPDQRFPNGQSVAEAIRGWLVK